MNDEEKKWSAMHLHERQNTNTFALSSAGNGTNATSQSNDNGEASQRRLHFHARSFGSSAAPYADDDDDVRHLRCIERLGFHSFELG